MTRLGTRRLRGIAATLFAALIAQSLAGSLHAAFEEHRWCALHDHMVHAHDADEGEPTSDAHGVSEAGSRPHAPTPCMALTGMRDGRLEARSGVLLASGVCCGPALRHVRSLRTVNVLSRAPKQGPPAVAV